MSENKSDQSNIEYSIHWIEDIVKEIEQRKPDTITLSTGKTPSGHIHLGIMRELLICDAIRKIFENRGKNVKYRLFLDDLDAAKRFPSYVDENYAKNKLGQPFALIPNPFEENGKNYAEVFGEELITVFPSFGIEVEPVWTHDLYRTNEMKDMIRIGLEKNEEVKSIVAKYLTANMTDEQKTSYLEQQKSWMGAMVICEKCQCTQKKLKDGTIKPNRALKYDKNSDKVEYNCPACGYQGKVSIESGLVKLNWRLDWPAKWTIFRTTCEPAGKDHCTPGGSYDTGLDLCNSIYGYEGPVKVSYEWVRLGDNDMKTSKGIVFTPAKFVSMVDPEILKMIIYQTNPNKHISIRIEELEQYYNEFERIERIYYGEESTEESELKEIQFIFPLIKVGNIPTQKPIRLPFRLLNVLTQLQPILGFDKIYNKAVDYISKENITGVLDFEEFKITITRMQNWIHEIERIISEEKDPGTLKKLSQKVEIFSFIDIEDLSINLDELQINALEKYISYIKSTEDYSEDKIKEIMITIREELDIKPMKIFQAFYSIMFGTKKGPRLGPLLAILDKEWIISRIKKLISSKSYH